MKFKQLLSPEIFEINIIEENSFIFVFYWLYRMMVWCCARLRVDLATLIFDSYQVTTTFLYVFTSDSIITRSLRVYK